MPDGPVRRHEVAPAPTTRRWEDREWPAQPWPAATGSSPAGAVGVGELSDLPDDVAQQARECQVALESAWWQLRSLRRQLSVGPGSTQDTPVAVVVTRPAEVAAVIRQVAAAARTELLVLGVTLLELVTQPAAVGDRPLMRVVTGPDDDMAALSWVAEGIRQGTVRVSRSPEPPPTDLIVADGSTAVVAAEAGGAVTILRDPPTVRLLSSTFHWAWAAARPCGPAPDETTADAVTKERILALLAVGAKDAVIARRLDMSLRTCRRHIAELMQAFGATSRFQAGANAVRAGRLPAPVPSQLPARRAGQGSAAQPAAEPA